MPSSKRTIIAAALALCLVAMAALPLPVRAEKAPSLSVAEAVRIATEAYIYGYPLVTFDMVRRQQTNVGQPDAEHAPMGQMIRMRTYPAVDNHCCAAPNADTLYTEAWLDVSAEPDQSLRPGPARQADRQLRRLGGSVPASRFTGQGQGGQLVAGAQRQVPTGSPDVRTDPVAALDPRRDLDAAARETREVIRNGGEIY